MKTKKLIRYRVSVSRTFPATHPRKGEETFFVDRISNSMDRSPYEAHLSPEQKREYIKKCHTIRGNFDVWVKRFEKINKGEAILELYYWSGKPYNSKCITICQLGKDHEIGIQKIEFDDYLYSALIDGNRFGEVHNLALNDGLTYADFEAWFKGADLSKPMAIIHFTNFRY